MVIGSRSLDTASVGIIMAQISLVVSDVLDVELMLCISFFIGLHENGL